MDETVESSPELNDNDVQSYNGTITADSNATPLPDLTASLDDHAFWEYAIFLLPCYIFIVIALKRLANLSNEAITTHGINRQPSIYIKKALSVSHVLIYAIQLIISSTQTPSVYWIAEYRSASLFYLLAIFAWILSMRLLDKEVERGLPQKYFEHRAFWILNFIVVCVKVSDPLEQKPVPLILNALKIFAGLYLTLYAIAKPYDSEEAFEANGQTNPLPLIRKLLVSIEELSCTTSLLGDAEYERAIPLLMNSRRESGHEQDADMFKDFLKEHNIKKTTPAQAGDWLKYLPIVKCSISRDVVVREAEGGEIRMYYEVKTHIDDNTHTKLHKYTDFTDLEEYIKKRCDPSKVAWIDREPPEFEKVEVRDFPDEKAFINARAQILEKYLNTLGQDPRYMNDKVIEFLGIPEPQKSAFLKYTAYLATSTSLKKRKPFGVAAQTEMVPMTTSQQKKKTNNDTDSFIPTLKVRCSHFQKSIYGDHYEYIFMVTDEKDPNNSWSIVKSYGDFKTFHDKLEKAVGKTIPYLNQYVPKPLNQRQTMEPAFVEKRKQGLDSYINIILKQPSYHTGALYEFLEYDVKRGTHASIGGSPKISGLGRYNE